jgi:WD40 repeat protein
MKLWEVSSGREVRTFQGHTEAVDSVAFSPDGRYALSGSRDQTVKLWDVSSGREARTFQGHTYWVLSVAFSPDGRYVLSGSHDHSMKLWEVSSGREVRTFQGHTDAVTSVAFSPDGRYALSGGYDKIMKLWEVSSGREVRTFQGHKERILSVKFSPDGRYALSGSSDDTMKLWEVSSGREIRTFQDASTVLSVNFSPDGGYALSGNYNGSMKLWEVSSGREIRTFQGHTDKVHSEAFSPDGRYALAGNDNGSMKLWEVSSGRQIRTFQGHTNYVHVAFSPDGRYALSGGLDKEMKLWEVSSGREIRTFQGHTNYLASVAFSPDGKYALSGSSDNTMKLWEVSSGREIRTFQGHKEYVDSVSFSPDGRYALSGSHDSTMKLWEVSSGREIRTFQVHGLVVDSVSFSPDGSYALSGSWDNRMKLWEVSSGREIRTFQGHTDAVDSVAFSPDGRYALSGSWDHTMKLWEVSSGGEIRTFRGYTNSVRSVAFSPDGRYALAGGASGATAIWDVASGREIASMIAFTDGEWVTITPEGYFNSSPNGARHLNVRIGNRVYGVDQFYAKFYRPELVQLALAGKELPKGESIGDVLAKKNAPTVRIVSPQSGVTFDKDSVIVSLQVTDNGGGIGNVNIYLNGSQVANDTRGVLVKGKESTTEKSLSFTVSLMDGDNEIKAVAMNAEGSMESNPAVITVISKAVLAKPNLYALIVGINEYKNKSISLLYAVPDALTFAETLRKTAEPLFGKTDIKTLTTPEETSKDAINRAFAGLRSKVKPNDLFVFYDASHGVVDVVDNEEQYFLLTSNVLLLSSRHIGTDAMSQKELGSLIGSIPAQKKLVILDTCNAGKGGKELQIALLQQTRGLTESTAVKLLQRSIGSAVFSASSDSQQALEGYKGHGLFTYVLLEGLQGKADIKKDGFITVLGLADYVEENVIKLSEEVFKRQQTPTIQTGANFPIGKVK